VYTIKIKDGKARLSNKKITYKPTFKLKGKKIYVHLLNRDGKDVKFDIYNSRDQKVHEEVVNGKTELRKIFDLSGSLNGKYDLRVWDANGIYTETFYIK